jgi:hypothetical protein
MPTTIFGRDEREPRSYEMVHFPFRFVGLLIACVTGVLSLFGIFRFTRIGAGYVGIEINLAGSQRGPNENTRCLCRR